MSAGAHSLAPPALTVVVLSRGRSEAEGAVTWRSLCQQDAAPSLVWLAAEKASQAVTFPRTGQCPGGSFRVITSESDTELLHKSDAGCFLFLAAGDQLMPHTLRRLGEFLTVYRDAQLIYADDTDSLGRPLPKRAWAPHATWSMRSPWHGLVFRRAYLEHHWTEMLADGRLDLGGCLLSAATGLPGQSVLHIPEPLLKLGTPAAEEGEYRLQVAGSLARQGLRMDAKERVSVPHLPAVTIVLADRASDHELAKAAKCMLEHPRAWELEVLIATSAARRGRLERRLGLEEDRARVVGVTAAQDPAGLPLLYNAAAQESTNPVLVFLHPQVTPACPDWLEELVTALHFGAASAAVPRLMDAQGLLIPPARFLGDTVAGVSPPPAESSPWDNVGAAHGIALAVRRSEFDAAGRFDERYTDAFFDLSLSARIRARGGSIVLAQRSQMRIPLQLLDPVLRNEDAEALVCDDALANAPADRLLCTLPGLWENCSTARSTALQPEQPVCPDDPAGVAMWALEHNVTLHAPEAGLEDIARDPGYVAAYILNQRLSHPEFRERFPRTLSSGPTGDFCAWLCQQAEQAGYGSLGPLLAATFANAPDTRVRDLFLQQATLRFFHPLGLLPEGCWRLAAWLLGEGRALHPVSNEDIWWFLIATHEQPERRLQETLALAENDDRSARPAEAGLNLLAPLQGSSAGRETALTLQEALGSNGESTRLLNSSSFNPPADLSQTGPAEWHDLTLLATMEPCARVYTEAHLTPSRDRHRIGYWHWPFESLPSDWADRARGLDEIWVPSHTAATALGQQKEIPVHCVPPPLRITPVSGSRPDLGWPEGTFIVMTSLTEADDVIVRNPAAVARAFHMAFRQGDAAQLVIKIGGTAVGHPRLGNLRDLARNIGAAWIEEEFPRARFLQMLASCDVYVSLHRGTSFGRTLAEAMWLGTPCMATDFGGHREFMNELNGRLVGCAMKPVDELSLAPTQGVHGAEADLGEASRCLRWMYENRDEVRIVAEKGRQEVRAFFDATRIIQPLRHRLKAIRYGRA